MQLTGWKQEIQGEEIAFDSQLFIKRCYPEDTMSKQYNKHIQNQLFNKHVHNEGDTFQTLFLAQSHGRNIKRNPYE